MLIALLTSITLQAGEDDKEEGLFFNSFEVNKDSRTRLNLTPDRPMAMPGGFTITFDFKIRPEQEVFGYIFRIIGNGSTNIDLISNSSQYHNIVLVVDNRTFIEFNLNELPTPTTLWTQASITVDVRRERLDFRLGDVHKSAVCDNIHGLNKFSIYFGGNDHPSFGTTDVAPFLLRNLKIIDGRNRMTRHWKMSRHSADAVFDECENARASVTNASWEIDRHAQWAKIMAIETGSKYPKIAFDRRRKQMYIVGERSLYIYNIPANSIDTLAYRQGQPFNVELNQLFYDSKLDCLIMYEFDTQTTARFDCRTQSWSNYGNQPGVARFRHHNKWYDERSGTGYMLGGYGFHQYSAVLQSFTGNEGRWDSVDLSASYPPRYLAGMGEYNDSLLLCFGGYGSVSGRQYEAPHNYYDLYELNPATRNIRKLWELTKVDEPFANSNSLVVNRARQTFYTLSYPNNVYETSATLHEYKINSPGYRKLADAVPFLFNDEESYCDLFMPLDSSALYAALLNSTPSGSAINIYAIAYPPLSLADTLQPSPLESWAHLIMKYLAVIAPIIFFVAAIAVLLNKRRRKPWAEPIAGQGEIEVEAPPLIKSSPAVQIAGPAINVLNNFRAIDSQGNDITHLFSPTGTQIFLLIYFKTVYDKTGITSNELQQTFWPEKDYESAQNNRNVYFTKLRSILSSMGNVRIDRVNNFWVLAFDANKMHSDFIEILRNIRHMSVKEETDRQLLRETLRIIGEGKLLPFLKADWLDHYKTGYANTVIEFLGQMSERPDTSADYQLLLHIADAILMQDEIEESGIRLKCSVLYKQGKKRQAMQSYDKYAETYRTLLDARPNFSFKDIIRRSTTV
ncbi:MAG: hypothetical protein LBC81_05090 [Tannerellaceae bacterium]|nr:hypothetical protein [Tannerellaceae bacterium]